MMARVLVLVGTKKGAFIVESDGERRQWTLRGPYCSHWPIHHLAANPATGAIQPDIRDCEGGGFASCDCEIETNNSPLCQANPNTGLPTDQVYAKAYPGIRPLQLARMLGDNAVASSICPQTTVPTPPGEPVVHYRPAMKQLGNRMARSLLPANN